MPRLLRMHARLPLAVHNRAARLALDSHAGGIRVVMLRLQQAAQVLRAD